MRDSSPTQLETLTSLQARGLLSAAAYQQQIDALNSLSATGGGSGLVWQAFAVLVAVVGCALAMPAVILQELQAGIGVLVGAAVIEEAMKPAGVYILLLRWPRALSGRLHIALLSALAGLTFGLIESLIYVTIYFPDEGSNFVLFRFTVPVLLHVVASFTVGLGLGRAVIDWAAGRAPFPKVTRNFYFAAVGLHEIYNIVAIALSVTGTLEFD